MTAACFRTVMARKRDPAAIGSTGDVLSRLTFDVEQVAHFPGFVIGMLLIPIAHLVGTAIVLFSMNWILAAILAPAVLFFAWLTWYQSGTVRALFQRLRESAGATSGVLQDNLAGLDVINGTAAEPWAAMRLVEVLRSSAKQHLRTQRCITLTDGALMFGGGLLPPVVVGAGILLLQNDALTVGSLVAFLFYLSGFYAPLQSLVNSSFSYQNCLAAAGRIAEIKEDVPAVTDPATECDLPHTAGSVQFDRVSFGYSEVPVLDSVSLSIAPGEHLAICGANGTGKTTLMRLLIGMYRPTQGRILVWGRDVESIPRPVLLRAVAYVPEVPFLFNTSIYENISLGRPGCDLEQVRSAAKTANAHEFIASLPEGYSTQVGERGARLSAGQKQLIALARALATDPGILILDEATSNIDAETRETIYRTLDTLKGRCTVITISHHRSLHQYATQVMELPSPQQDDRGERT